jgi:hypothetical protein
MEFEVTTYHPIVDEETGEMKPSHQWTDDDLVFVSDLHRDDFQNSVSVPYRNITDSREPIRDAGDGFSSFTARIEVEPHDVLKWMDVDEPPATDASDVEFGTERHHEDHVELRGEVYGRAGYQAELESKVLRNTVFEELSYFSFSTGFNHSPSEDGTKKWLPFVAEGSMSEYLAVVGSSAQFCEAIRGEERAAIEWLGYS